jgi:hypothetical protein
MSKIRSTACSHSSVSRGIRSRCSSAELTLPRIGLQRSQLGGGTVRGPRPVQQAAEVEQVQRRGVGVDAVAVRHRLDHAGRQPVLAQEPAQPQDAGLHRGLGRLRRLLAPDGTLQIGHRDHRVGVQQQRSQQGGRFGRRKDRRLAAVGDAQWPQNGEPDLPGSRFRVGHGLPPFLRPRNETTGSASGRASVGSVGRVGPGGRNGSAAQEGRAWCRSVGGSVGGDGEHPVLRVGLPVDRVGGAARHIEHFAGSQPDPLAPWRRSPGPGG